MWNRRLWCPVGAAGFLTGALRRLEHRGYDPAGIAVTGIRRDELFLVRSVGRVATLQDRIAARSSTASAT